MAGIKISEIRNMTEDELINKENTLKEELFKLRFQATMGRIEKPHRVGQIRKTIAQIKTILKEKEHARAKGS